MPGYMTSVAATLAAHGNVAIGGPIAASGVFSAGPPACALPIID
jgi:hypothetical protein